MAEPKIKPAKREAGKSKFRLPERAPRPVEENPLRALLKEAKAQEAALEPKPPRARPDTPARKIAGVSVNLGIKPSDTPAIPDAGVVPRASHAEADAESSATTFAEFSRRWSPILRSGQ